MVYFINIFLIFAWAVILLKNNPNQTKRKIYCGIVALQWILISGLRHISVGGADNYSFYARFEMTKTTSWKTILQENWDYIFNGLDAKDPGYTLVTKVFQIFSNDFQVFLIFIAVVFTSLMAWWIYKYSSMPEISFFIYSVIFYAFYAVTGYRQTLATALIVFLGYDFAKDRKWVKFAIVSFIAFMLHKSSVVFIVYYFIANINLTVPYVSIMSIAILAVAVLGIRLYGPIALALGFEEAAIMYDGGGAETYATALLLVCIATFVVYPWVKKRRQDAKYLYNMMFLTTASTLLIYQQQGFMRIQQYYSLFIMIMIPELILSIEKKYRTLAYICVVGVLLLYLIGIQPRYRFFFQ